MPLPVAVHSILRMLLVWPQESLFQYFLYCPQSIAIKVNGKFISLSQKLLCPHILRQVFFPVFFCYGILHITSLVAVKLPDVIELLSNPTIDKLEFPIRSHTACTANSVVEMTQFLLQIAHSEFNARVAFCDFFVCQKLQANVNKTSARLISCSE